MNEQLLRGEGLTAPIKVTTIIDIADYSGGWKVQCQSLPESGPFGVTYSDALIVEVPDGMGSYLNRHCAVRVWSNGWELLGLGEAKD